jgi:hypothetical protein
MEESGRYRASLEHWFWRPRLPPLKDPRAWFRYAARCVRSQVHHRRSASKYGQHYTFLYSRMLLAQHWEVSDQAELVRMEKHLSAESLATFRLAAKQMAQTQEAAAKAAERERRSQQSWGQWAKSFVASTAVDTAEISDLDPESQRILKEAVQQVEAADDEMEMNAYPHEYARYRIDFHATMGSLTLVEQGWLPGSEAQELCYMQFNDLDGQYRIRRSSYQYSFELVSIMVDDRKNNVHGLSQIASCRSGNLNSDGSHGGFANNDAGTGSGATKLLKWNYDTLPLSDSDNDGGEMSIIVDGLNLVYSVESVLGIYNFWFVPRDDRFSRGEDAAEEEQKVVLEEELPHELNLWLDRTRYCKRMKWQLSVLQPCILFPGNAKDATEPIIFFDLDRFSWGSEFPETGVHDIMTFYDRSVMSVENTRFRLVDDIETWLHCTANRRLSWVMRPITLAQEFDFSITWDRCKLPEEIRVVKDVPHNVLTGTLPRVHICVTGHQYCTFWYVFFKVIKSHWGTPEEQALEAAKPQRPVRGSGCSMTLKFKMHELKLNMREEGASDARGEKAVEIEDGGEDRASDAAAFAMMTLSGFIVSYENGNIAKLDMQMDGLSIQDLIQHCVFATSDTDVGGVSKGSFVSIQRGWAVRGAQDHPGCDTWWSFDFRTLGLNWNDRTVALLMQFCSTSFATHPKVG